MAVDFGDLDTDYTQVYNYTVKIIFQDPLSLIPIDSALIITDSNTLYTNHNSAVDHYFKFTTDQVYSILINIRIIKGSYKINDLFL